MMIESECNSNNHLTRTSPMNGRHSLHHHRHHLLSNNQCVPSADTTDNALPSGSPVPRKRISVCMGCGQEIYDQYILRVAPDLEWHAACLKCVDCQQFLDETCTCFVRDGKIYCRRDYVRQFGVKCAKCNQLFHKNDYVMRARTKIYHIDCFRCMACGRPLPPGEEFALREDGLFCKDDHESMSEKCMSTIGPQVTTCATSMTTAAEATIAALCDPTGSAGLVDSSVGGSELDMLGGGPLSSFHHPNSDNGRTPPLGFPLHASRSLPTPLGVAGSSQQPKSLSSTTSSSTTTTTQHQQQQQQHSSFLQHQQSSSCSVSSPESFAGDERSNSGHGGADEVSTTSTSGGGGASSSGIKKDKKDKPKTTRVRTVLNEKQLHTLRTCYAANPRPDALMKEQLVEMTGLSPRVIRVWFQNKRCKDKKKQILMKQLQQQQEKNQTLNGIRLQGVGPLIAPSPTRHDMPMVQPLDVHQYQQSSALWVKAHAMAASVPDYHHHGAPLPPEHTMHQLESHHQTPFQQLMHGFGDPHAAEAAALGGCYMQSSAAFGPAPTQQTGPGGCGVGAGGLDPADLTSLSPQLAPSDLSSPSCSE